MNHSQQGVKHVFVLLAGIIMASMVFAPFWVVTHSDTPFASVYVWPGTTQQQAYAIFAKAGVQVVRPGYKNVYLVTSTSPNGMYARLRSAGAPLVLPPGMGLGCDYSEKQI